MGSSLLEGVPDMSMPPQGIPVDQGAPTRFVNGKPYFAINSSSIDTSEFNHGSSLVESGVSNFNNESQCRIDLSD